MKDIDEYAKWVETLWISHDKHPDISLAIMSLGLSGEIGEVQEHIKKRLRDGKWDEEAFKKELGDAIYYWCKVCNHFEISPSEILALNQHKLNSRKERNVLSGSGDNR